MRLLVSAVMVLIGLAGLAGGTAGAQFTAFPHVLELAKARALFFQQ